MAKIGYVEEADFTAYAAVRGITLLLSTSQTLTRALDYIELQSYKDKKTDPLQVLQFPRNGETVVPANILNAQMQTALVYDAGSDPLAANGQKILVDTVGPISTTFSDKGGNTTTYPAITGLLRPYLSSAGGNSFKVSRG